jgi:hypothetical protein
LLAVKWLDGKFAERLEAFKHAQAKELEELRFRTNSLFDRLKKLNEKEYEVLPEAWGRLNEAFWKTQVLVSPFRSYPDVEKMTEQHFTEFVASCRLNEWEKAELARSEEKNAYYQAHIFGHDMATAQAASRECHIYLAKNGIFLQPAVKDKFRRIDDLIWNALSEHETLEQIKPTRERSAAVDEFRTGGESILRELESIVQDRLHE